MLAYMHKFGKWARIARIAPLIPQISWAHPQLTPHHHASYLDALLAYGAILVPLLFLVLAFVGYRYISRPTRRSK